MSGHRHTMGPGVGGVHKCSSCLFRCTTATLGVVNSPSSKHFAVKAGHPQATKVWGR